ncbi:MAG: ABC transporter permease [Dehalococcoidia bacterium]
MAVPAARTAWSVIGLPVKRLVGLKLVQGIDFSHGAGKLLLQLFPIALLIGVWWIYAALQDIPRIYPTPWVVMQDFWDIMRGEAPYGGSSYSHIWATLYRLFIAFGLSVLIGSVIGLVIGRSKLAFNLFDNIGWIFMSVPLIVWAFIFVVALGITDRVPILAVMALLVPKVALLVGEGAKAIPNDIMEMAKSFKVTTWQKVRDVFLPHLLPYLLASSRIAFSLGVKVIILAEVVGLSRGTGFMINYWRDKVFLGPIIAWGMVLILIALLMEYGLFRVLERNIAKWRLTGSEAATSAEVRAE